MNIAIIALGSRGDVQPYVALGKGLIRAGNFVRIISNQDFEDLITSHGLDFWPIEVNLQDYVQSQKMREILENGSLLKSMAEMAKGMRRSASLLAKRSISGCTGMDLIIAGLSGVFIGLAIAEKNDLPLLQAYNVPLTPTRAFSGALAHQLSGPLTLLSHQLTRQILWQANRPTDRLVRKDILELPPSPFFGPFHSNILNQLPVLYGISPAVLPHPQDWDPTRFFMTGFWNLEAETDWHPPDELEKFLEKKPTPLYIGFGSMSNQDPKATAELVFQALERTGQRAVVYSGWGGLSGESLPGSVLMVDALPHDWLFAYVQAVVHHGGAGTTASSLRAGVPSILIPQHGDQPFWGRLVANLGVGPEPIPRRKLNVKNFSEAIHFAVNDSTMRHKAAILGEKIRGENGITRAVEIMHGLLL